MPMRKRPPFFGSGVAGRAQDARSERGGDAEGSRATHKVAPTDLSLKGSKLQFVPAIHALPPVSAEDTMSIRRLLRDGSSGFAQAVLNNYYAERPTASQ